MRAIGHFIGGKEVKGSSGRFADVFNPNTGEVQAKVALANRSEMQQAIAGANFHIGIIAGKLKGVIPATTPSGWRRE